MRRGADAFLSKPLHGAEIQHMWQFAKKLPIDFEEGLQPEQACQPVLDPPSTCAGSTGGCSDARGDICGSTSNDGTNTNTGQIHAK